MNNIKYGLYVLLIIHTVAVAYRGGEVWGVQTPSEIPNALKNRVKLKQIVKTVKNC